MTPQGHISTKSLGQLRMRVKRTAMSSRVIVHPVRQPFPSEVPLSPAEVEIGVRMGIFHRPRQVNGGTQ